MLSLRTGMGSSAHQTTAQFGCVGVGPGGVGGAADGKDARTGGRAVS
jgi:hypothetical protein